MDEELRTKVKNWLLMNDCRQNKEDMAMKRKALKIVEGGHGGCNVIHRAAKDLFEKVIKMPCVSLPTNVISSGTEWSCER